MVLAPRSRFTLEDFQRSSDENKQIWWSFADSQSSGRDLAWYEEGLLQACLAEHGIDGVQGTAEQNFANGEVIIKIKAFQRSARPPPPWGWEGGEEGEGSQNVISKLDANRSSLFETTVWSISGLGPRADWQ